MKNSSSIWLAVILGLLAAGCATAPDESSKADAAPAAEAPAPDGEPAEPLPSALTPDLLYQLLVGEISAQRGALDVSVREYMSAARTVRDPRVAERAARIALFSRDDESALEAATLWVELEPDSVDARQMLAALLIRKGETDAALEHLKIIIASSGDPDQGFFLIANLLSREQDVVNALKVMQQLVSTHDDSPHAWLAYSYLAGQAGELDLARTAIERALALKPDWPKAAAQYARVLQRQGDLAAAVEYMGRVVKGAPDDMNLRLAYARLLVEAERFGEARKQFEILAEQAPDAPDIQYALGVLAMEAGDLDAAEKYLVELARDGERSLDVRLLLGQLEEQRKDYQAAIDWYASVDRGTNYIDAQIRISQLLAKQGDIQGARAHLQRTSASGDEQQVRLYLAESDVLRDAGMYAEAKLMLDAALEKIPGETDLLYARSLIAEKLDDLVLAESDLREILAKEPDNAHALNALGYTLADRTTRYEEALGYIERALELRPQDPAILDSMGWVQYRLGNFDESVRYLRRALELLDDAEIAAHLGEVLWVAGDREGAREVWNRAMQQFPDDQLLLEVQGRFRQ